MNDPLFNPVYNALRTGDKSLALGIGQVKYFDKPVSPFVGFEEGYANGFSDLYDQLPNGRNILYAHPVGITEPPGWEIKNAIKGLQFVYDGQKPESKDFSEAIALTVKDIDQMVALATLTRPGPFGAGTINFGHYHGIFDGEKLVAMTGQRLHVENHSEISAVCTHPDYTGKGYAYILMQKQLQIILQHEEIPFLHVRADNERAVALYKRCGLKISRDMNFYFMKKRD